MLQKKPQRRKPEQFHFLDDQDDDDDMGVDDDETSVWQISVLNIDFQQQKFLNKDSAKRKKKKWKHFYESTSTTAAHLFSMIGKWNWILHKLVQAF